ncbi:hypothetical protein DET54_1166 [Paenibacillus pabuli]|uniref:Uncharacterized protein n=1 Tax=Paenibacillus pabuli TaxID=1472 RepID=A0ABX9BDT3_9BACL|nr:hypothetical protein DET54_1166 [Paenibacillus pabuli]
MGGELYYKGQIVEEALEQIGVKAVKEDENFTTHNSPTLYALGFSTNQLAPLRTYHNIKVWKAKVLSKGAFILKELDNQFERVSTIPENAFDSFFKEYMSAKEAVLVFLHRRHPCSNVHRRYDCGLGTYPLGRIGENLRADR